jgi:hypothetical protein
MEGAGMTNVQLYLATGVPIIAILISMTISLFQISGVRGSIQSLSRDIREDMREMRTEFREEMRLLRADLTTLTSKVIEIDNRLTRIEERMAHGRS